MSSLTKPTADGVTDPAYLQRLGLSAALAAALRTGVLTSLASLPGGSSTDGELARRLGLDLRATTLLLDILATHGFAVREGGRLSAGPELLALTRSPGGSAFALGLWAHVEHFVRTGEPFTSMDLSAPERDSAYRSMVSDLAVLFEDQARALAARLPLRPRNILDVGCGSGVWSLALAERFGDARVTGLDLPSVLDNFAARAKAFALTDRTHTIASDMHEASIPRATFDLAIIANVLRLEPPDRAESLVRRVAEGVLPGGAMLIIDALPDGTLEGARAVSLYALHLGLRTRTAQVHAPAAISQWLADAGLPGAKALEMPEGTRPTGALLATKS